MNLNFFFNLHKALVLVTKLNLYETNLIQEKVWDLKPDRPVLKSPASYTSSLSVSVLTWEVKTTIYTAQDYGKN